MGEYLIRSRYPIKIGVSNIDTPRCFDIEFALRKMLFLSVISILLYFMGGGLQALPIFARAKKLMTAENS